MAARIRQLRESAGIPATKLSVAIGCSHSMLGQLESGRVREPGGARLVLLAEALGTTAQWLVTGEGSAPKPAQVARAFAAFCGRHGARAMGLARTLALVEARGGERRT